MRSDGTIALYDWKRSKGLSSKYSNRWARMTGVLSDLEDCEGVHYRLQLNCYRFILEKYYEVSVSAHPPKLV